MQVNIAKTYACRKATRISNPVNATEKLSGNHPPNIPKLTTNPPNTFNIVCPAIIFANKRTDKLTGLLKYEIISYLSRPVSLSVRLFANMMAGHTMLKVFGGFVVSLGILGGWLPLSFSVALTGLEILVAFLQAYVFAILTCIYLNDALNLHH